MTALQDWLSFRPVEDGIKDMVFRRPLRAVLSVVEEFDEAVDGALERLAAHANGPHIQDACGGVRGVGAGAGGGASATAAGGCAPLQSVSQTS